MGGKEQILDQLLRDGGCAAGHFSRVGAVLDHLPHLAPVDAVMLVEVPVLSRDHGMLELRRDAAERHERVALLVRALREK